MGKNQLRLLKFAIKYQGWQSYGTDRSTVAAVKSLAEMELIVLGNNRQFKLNNGK